eukprot:m.207019 g.207019  ORF g.207019 m.207019 type:complete len:661 (-) comp16912_c2_seq3:1654-3636(-)
MCCTGPVVVSETSTMVCSVTVTSPSALCVSSLSLPLASSLSCASSSAAAALTLTLTSRQGRAPEMAGFLRTIRRLSSAALDEVDLYYADMTIEEFCVACNLIEFAEKFKQEGASSVDDICEFEKDLMKSCNLGAVHKGKLVKGIRHYQYVKKKGIRKSGTLSGRTSGLHSPTASEGSPNQGMSREGSDRSLRSQNLSGSRTTLSESTPSENGALYEAPEEQDTSSLLSPPPYTPQQSGMQPPLLYQNDGVPSTPGLSYGAPIVQLNYNTGESLDYEEVNDGNDDYEQPTEGGDIYDDPDSSQPVRPPAHQGGLPNIPPAPLAVRERPESVLQEPAAAPLPADPKDWNNAEVLRYLREHDLQDFKNIIYANGFSGADLLELSSSQFKSNFAPDRCQALGKALDELKKQSKAAQRSKGKGEKKAEDPSPPVPTRGFKPPVPTPAERKQQQQQQEKEQQQREQQKGTEDVEQSDDDYSHLPSAKGETHKVARALHDFTASDASQLSIQQDEMLTIVDDTQLWWVARNARGEEGFVPSNFMEVVSTASETAPAPETPRREEDEPWFHGAMHSRVDAEAKLKAMAQTGAFMIRPSATNPDSKTLSILGATSVVIHLKILKDPRGFYLAGTDIYRQTLTELVEYFQDTEIKVSNREPVLLTTPCRK